MVKPAYAAGQAAQRAGTPRASNPHSRSSGNHNEWDCGHSDASCNVNMAPTPAEVKGARLDAGLTQVQAARLVHWGDYRRWSERETGKSPMPPAEWELFLFKTGKK